MAKMKNSTEIWKISLRKYPRKQSKKDEKQEKKFLKIRTPIQEIQHQIIREQGKRRDRDRNYQ